MRLALASCLLLAAAPLHSATAPPPAPAAPASAHILLHAHPRAWRPPAPPAPVAAGMRVEPETAPDATLDADLAALRAASARARAGVVARIEPDGSLHAVLGGAVRMYTVVRVGADGRLEQECLHSEAEALARVKAAARPGGN